jgi:ribosomal protein S18 acetylase RimI-like enzyme
MAMILANMGLDLQEWKMSSVSYKLNTSSLDDIKNHLCECSSSFAPPLDTYVDIDEYSHKMFDKSFRFEAYDTGKLIGLITTYLNDEQKICFITNFSLLKSYMGSDVSSTLLNECRRYVTENNYYKIKLEVYECNTRAINFYKKHKFTVLNTNENSKIEMELTLKKGKSLT